MFVLLLSKVCQDVVVEVMLSTALYHVQNHLSLEVQYLRFVTDITSNIVVLYIGLEIPSSWGG